jgi:hypothetical protein
LADSEKFISFFSATPRADLPSRETKRHCITAIMLARIVFYSTEKFEAFLERGYANFSLPARMQSMKKGRTVWRC